MMIFSQNQRICIKLKHMLSGNTLQFYDQIGSNMEEQQMKQQMAKEYRNTEERESTVKKMQCKPGRRKLSTSCRNKSFSMRQIRT